MTVHVLIVTPSPGLGELIHQVLEEAGDYFTALVGSGKEAVEYLEAEQPSICILDADLTEVPLSKLGDVMRKKCPGLLFVLIPPEEDNNQAELDALNADGKLNKPFYLPDLVPTVEDVARRNNLISASAPPAKTYTDPADSLADEPEPQKKSTPPPAKRPTAKKQKKVTEPPTWLQNVDLAAQHLTRLTLESASQAALITRADEIWAYAGELSQPAAQEIARSVAHYWGEGADSDLARFIRLDQTGTEHMMYATGIGGDYVLALVFDAATPFSKIRSQAGDLARSLATAPQDIPDQPVSSSAKPKEFSPAHAIEWEVSDELPDQEHPLPLLDDVPPSVPSDWVPEHHPTPAHAQGHSGPAAKVALDDYQEIKFDPDQTQVSAPSRPDPQPGLAETVPSRKASPVSRVKLEPVSPAMYSLTYACVLLPRFPDHHLTGNLATQLSDAITQLCLAFGWRLEQIAIRPEYVEWMVNVPPTTSPGYLMRIIRQHTSRRMFIEFPHFEEKNPSGDFWAPGYLIMSGDQSPPPQLVKDFINQTRQRQGAARK